MLFSYVSLIGGLAALIVAGDILVRGSVGIALRLGIPNLIIGLTIVAFGTSAPELVISLQAAFAGSGGIAIGNVVGSNIANVLMVLGMPALIAATPCGEKGATRNALFMVAVTVIFIVLCFNSPLSLLSGLVLLALLALFLGDSVRATRSHRKAVRENGNGSETTDDLPEEVEDVPQSAVTATIYIVLGLIGLPLGAHFVIEGATDVARSWGVTDAVIALTVIALGTSLPELATTMMAAVRNQGAVAIGNVIGSNVFNLLAIIGITAAVVPVDVAPEFLRLDVWIMLACAVLLLFLAARKVELRRFSGLALVGAYCLYIFVVYWMGKVA
ncbi:calcium/sodium antiporter [Polymorphum gilvum]|uniref:K+-dependent Na+/Ca+ exchanger related-protein n=1 Tax=Polymorphum gilvum (strain LMG 25793 / CGMCC 1.9160 / SL003B-26A1) TaxID=991905 RepID=F2J0H7_POLGS|nr:calcium/sodium antiporter [Polymorphum gilvum]ADZ69645.1 K+-dependent Na+/Ca+ exchanger related-protein [Polymorphum gilvum SL003B-26A1]